MNIDNKSIEKWLLVLGNPNPSSKQKALMRAMLVASETLRSIEQYCLREQAQQQEG